MRALWNSPAFSPLGLLGWALIIGAGMWDLVYHLAPLFFAVRWAPLIEVLGEFGHIVIFAGMVIVVFAVLFHYRQKRIS